MTNSQVRKHLNSLDLSELAAAQRGYGRLGLPLPLRQKWTEIHGDSRRIIGDDRYSRGTMAMADLLFQLTFSVATLPEDSSPNYYQYIDAHVLDWYLSPDMATLPHLKKFALSGLFYLLRDLLKFESESLAGFTLFSTESFDRSKVHSRIDLIRDAVDACNRAAEVVIGRRFDAALGIPRYGTLESYATQQSRLPVLVHLTGFPLTQKHDEVLFIRVLHGSELCFFGIRTCLTAAIESLKLRKIQLAERELRHATAIGELLYRLLKVLTSMPVEHFAEFRDFTSKASALQSINYHLLEIHFKGLNTGKADHFGRVEQLKGLLQYGHERFVNLSKVLSLQDEQELSGSKLIDVARSLDRQLLTWRGLHLSFALKYIPQGAPGTGGTEGAAYLERHRKAGLFDDTEMDLDVVREMFPDDPHLPDRLRLHPRAGIAPSEELLAEPAKT